MKRSCVWIYKRRSDSLRQPYFSSTHFDAACFNYLNPRDETFLKIPSCFQNVAVGPVCFRTWCLNIHSFLSVHLFKKAPGSCVRNHRWTLHRPLSLSCWNHRIKFTSSHSFPEEEKPENTLFSAHHSWFAFSWYSTSCKSSHAGSHLERRKKSAKSSSRNERTVFTQIHDFAILLITQLFQKLEKKSKLTLFLLAASLRFWQAKQRNPHYQLNAASC